MVTFKKLNTGKEFGFEIFACKIILEVYKWLDSGSYLRSKWRMLTDEDALI